MSTVRYFEDARQPQINGDLPCEEEFLPDSEPDEWISADEYSRVCNNRDHYLRAMCIYVSDMEAAARHLMWAIHRFGPQMEAFDRAQLLEAHARLAYPQATFEQDIAQLIERTHAQTLIDIADAETGEVLHEELVLGFVFPGNYAEHARIMHDIERDGFAIIGGDDGPRRRITESRAPKAVRQ
jgi:hypothetical protein